MAAVTRPLMSVGRICDEGHEVLFNNISAVVRDSGVTAICRFTRQPGGLYVAKMKLRSPMVLSGRNELWVTGPSDVLKTRTYCVQ